jgi:hypothetical protein
MKAWQLPLIALFLVLATSKGSSAENASNRPARSVAQAFAEAIMARDATALVPLFWLPANLDGERFADAEALEERWRAILSRSDMSHLSLVNIELLPLATAISRYGAPPQRLGELARDASVAIVELNRAQLVLVIARQSDRWAIVAATD